MSLIAVDIGNSRIKLGLFDQPSDNRRFLEPTRTLELTSENWQAERILTWLPKDSAKLEWAIASVNRPVAAGLLHWIGENQTDKVIPLGKLHEVTYKSLDLRILVEQPDRVGIDRLLGAVAANLLKSPTSPAITISVGSAIVVNSIGTDGAFRGGAILPGIGMAARAMHVFTDALPQIPMDELSDAPPAIGNSTIPAMRAGLYWGAVGAMRELITRMSEQDKTKPEIFLTGGAAPSVAEVLDLAARHIPYLVLGAIAHVVFQKESKHS
jgi:type III pantothenate kinase